MPFRKPFIPLVVVLVSSSYVFEIGARAAPPTSQGTDEYQRWVSHFAATQVTEHMFEGDDAAIKLAVTAVYGEDSTKKPRPFSGVSYQQTMLTTDGRLISRAVSDFDVKGFGGGKALPEGTLKQIASLLQKLPDDGGILPPANRRLMVQTVQGDHLQARVYDRANAPDVVWELMRASGCHVSAWVETFEPQSQLDGRNYEWGGFLAFTSDGKQLCFSSMNGPLYRWDSVSRKPLPEVRGGGGYEIAFSPDGATAFICAGIEARVFETKTWTQTHRISEQTDPLTFRQMFHPWFTPDGKYLAVRTNDPRLRFYDARTWENVATPADIPTKLYAYEQSPDGKYAVLERLDGAVELWNAREQTSIAKLDNGVHLVFAAFSPDGSKAAAVTANKREFAGYYDGFRIRVWSTGKGEFVHEMRAYEQSAGDHVEGLVWSPDSAYLLAMTGFGSSSEPRGIAMWDAKTGRHGGQFTGLFGVSNGITFTPDGKQIVAGCVDGKIRFWDFEAAETKVRDFEKSLHGL